MPVLSPLKRTNTMNIDFLDSVRKTICENGMIKKGDKVAVGFSGGADSTALLHALYLLKDELGFSLCAAHINHGIRGKEAERDENFARDFCKNKDIPFFCLHADVPSLARMRKLCLEDAGRQVRYEFFEKCAAGGKIATAHTLSDNVETMVMRLCRGSGLKGMCGIPPVRDNIIRPLINCSREQVEDFCRRCGLDFVTDSTNLECDYGRNRVRNKIIPLLKDLNPEFERAAGRFADCARADEELLEKLTAKALERLVSEKGLDAKGAAALEKGLLFRVLKEYLRPFSPEFSHICAVKDILGGGSANLPGGKKAVCDGNYLTVTSAKRPQFDGFSKELSLSEGQTQISALGKSIVLKPIEKNENSEINGCQKINNLLSYTLLDRDKIGKTVVVRTRLPGDRITLSKRGCTKTLKKLWNEKGFDQELRDRFLIIESDGRLVFSEPDGADASAEVTNETEKILSVEIFAEG